jgi:hypothetical protein
MSSRATRKVGLQRHFEETHQVSCSFRESQLAQSRKLDLASPFPGNAKHFAKILEGMDAAAGKPIVEADNRAFAIIQSLQDFRDPGFQQILVRAVERIIFAVILQQFAEVVILPSTDRLVQ